MLVVYKRGFSTQLQKAWSYDIPDVYPFGQVLWQTLIFPGKRAARLCRNSSHNGGTKFDLFIFVYFLLIVYWN